MKAFEILAIYLTPFLIRWGRNQDFNETLRHRSARCPKAGWLQAEAQISARSLAYRRMRRPLIEGHFQFRCRMLAESDVPPGCLQMGD